MPRRFRMTVLSTFTGAGGLDLGLESAGFRTVACIEIDPTARRTIGRNRPGWNLLSTGDIATVAPKLQPRDVGLRKRELGLLAGGPPCQPFSKAAQWAERGRSGLRDPRAKCLDGFVELADAFLPRAILIENVPGFVRGKTSALPALERAFARINERHGTKYHVEYRILNAADYGVPQRRLRAIVVARRDGCSFVWPTPTHVGRPVRSFDALLGVKAGAPPRMSGYWRGLIGSIPEGRNYLFHTADGDGLPLFGRRRWFWSFLLKLSQREPAWTLPARPGPATGPFHWENRPLTVQEMQRLQTFPLGWRIEGSRLASVRQVGNATPPLLAEVVGRALGAAVFGASYDSAPRLRIPRRRSEPRETSPRPVPARYLAHLNTQKPHPGEGRGPGALRRTNRRAA